MLVRLLLRLIALGLDMGLLVVISARRQSRLWGLPQWQEWQEAHLGQVRQADPCGVRGARVAPLRPHTVFAISCAVAAIWQEFKRGHTDARLRFQPGTIKFGLSCSSGGEGTLHVHWVYN